MEKYIESNNVKIYMRLSLIDSKKAVVVIHGLAEHSGRYLEFMQDLNNAGYSVFAIDLRGHGLTQSKRGDCESIKKVIDDIDCVVNHIKENYSINNVCIFGHSIGGLVASLYASLSNKVDSLILSSPAIYCPKKLKIMRFIPYKLLPFIYVRKKHSESQEMLEVSLNDKLALHKFSIRTVGIFFNDGIKKLNKDLNILCPVLLVYGEEDRLLNEQKNFKHFMQKLKNTKNKLISYKNAKHRIVHNQGKEKRIADIIAWLKQVF